MKKIIGILMTVIMLLLPCNTVFAINVEEDVNDVLTDLSKVVRETNDNEPHGIIIMQSGRFGGMEITLIHQVDPQTGAATFLTGFQYRLDQSIIAPSGWYGNLRDAFTSDFTKMAATHYDSNGVAHAGWINQDGSFTDVSGKLMSNKYDATNPGYFTYGFRDDQTLTYYAWVNDKREYYHARINGKVSQKVSRADRNDPYVYFWENYYSGQQTWSKTVLDKMRPCMVIDSRYVLSDIEEEGGFGVFLQTRAQKNCVITTQCYPQRLFTDLYDLEEYRWSPALSPDGQKLCYLSVSVNNPDQVSLKTISTTSKAVTTIPVTGLFWGRFDEYGEEVTCTVLDWR